MACFRSITDVKYRNILIPSIVQTGAQSKIPLSRCRQHLQQFQSTVRDLLLTPIETQSFTATEGLARGLPLSVSNGTGISKWRFGYGSHSNPTLMPRRFHSVPFVEITAIALQSGHCHLAVC